MWVCFLFDFIKVFLSSRKKHKNKKGYKFTFISLTYRFYLIYIYFLGVIARFLTWSPKNDDNADRVIGEKYPITGDVIVDVVPSSRDLKGNDLWQLSTYASTDPTGNKKLTPVFRQVLNPAKASTPLSDGGPLVLEDVVTEPYPVDELGCGEAKYLCFELQKSNGSDVDFAFETTAGDDALIECIRQECESELP